MSSSQSELVLLPEEFIKWEGQPDYTEKEQPFSFKQALHLLLDLLVNLESIAIFLVFTYLLYKGIIGFKECLPFLLLLVVALIYQGTQNYIERTEKSAVKYFITNQRIFFRSWHFLKGIKYHTIDLVDVQQLSLEELKNGTGNIYFMGAKLGGYKNTEHYPALLLILDAKELMPRIQEIVKECKRKPKK